MGTCSSIYIEFKKRSDKQWHLLEAVVPLDYRDRSWDEEDLDGNQVARGEGLWARHTLCGWCYIHRPHLSDEFQVLSFSEDG